MTAPTPVAGKERPMRRYPAGGRFVVAALLLMAVGCHREGAGGTGPSGSGATTGVCAGADRTLGDALATVCTVGVIHVAMDPARKPTSWYDADTGEWNGFDTEVANEIAKRLGVRASLDPATTAAIASREWRGRWDMSVSSIPDTSTTQQRLLFSPAYYYDPVGIAVAAGDTGVTGPADLAGATVCVAAGSTEEAYARSDLTLGSSASPAGDEIRGVTVRTLPNAETALQELSSGGPRCDAVLARWWEVRSFIDGGGELTLVGEPLYYVPFAVAFDDHDARDMRRLLAAVSGIVNDMHDDGTLAALSEKWFEGADRTVASPPPSASASP